jgi:hypothetical protein
VFVIRDQDLVNPNAPPAKSEQVVPKFLVDRDGDAANTGTGFGKPAKDLSINYVPVPYPDYAPAVIEMRPKERQLWRVLNASAITYLNIEVLFNHAPQALGVVAMDGVPLSHDDPQGDMVSWQKHLVISPGRAGRVYCGWACGWRGWAAGDAHGGYRPRRRERSESDAPEPRSTLSSSPEPLAVSPTPWFGAVASTATRRLQSWICLKGSQRRSSMP